MSTRWRGGPATAIAILTVVCLLLNTVYVGPAGATDTDLAAGKNIAVSRGWQGSLVPDNGVDTNSATRFQQTGGSSNQNGQYCIDLGADYVVDSWRLNVNTSLSGSLGGHFSIESMPASSGAAHGFPFTNNSVGGDCTTVSSDWTQRVFTGGNAYITTPGDSGVVAFAASFTARYIRYGFDSLTGGCGVCIADAEVWGHATAPAIVSASAYFRNVFVSQTSAYVRVSWQWVASYTGTWSAVDNTSSVGCGGTFGSGTDGTADATVVTLDRFTSVCFVTDVGPLVLSVNDTGANQTASLTIPGTARGNVPVGDTTPAGPEQQPIVTMFAACTNASANFCDPSTATGYGWVKYIVRADETTATATVSLYPASGGVLGSALFDDVAVALDGATIHKHTFSSLPTGTYVLYARNASGSTTISLDVTAGFSAFDIVPTPSTGNEVCGQIDPACAVRNAVRSITCQNNEECWTDRLLSVPSLLITDAANKLHDTLAAKQPFATILASGGVILGQLGRATSAVTTTNSCTGVTITVPLRVATMTAPPVGGMAMPTPPLAPTSIPGMAGRTAGPASVTVLDCATFESFTSQWTWWPTVRSFLDVAVYAAYGYGLLVRYDVKFRWST